MPGPEEGDRLAERLRGEARPYRTGDNEAERDQPVRRAVMDAVRTGTCDGAERQAASGGGMAQSGGVLPWRHRLHTLPGAIPAAHHQAGHELHGDLQRLRRLLRYTGRPGGQQSVAHDRLWCVLRVPAHGRVRQRTPEHCSIVRRGDRTQLCHDHQYLLRIVAL